MCCRGRAPSDSAPTGCERPASFSSNAAQHSVGGLPKMRQAEGREVVIVEAVRTPIGRGHKEKGYYKDTHPNALRGKTYTEVIKRSGIDPAEVEDVVAGCVQQFGEQGFNIARNAWLQEGLPIETPGTTIDRQCGSA